MRINRLIGALCLGFAFVVFSPQPLFARGTCSSCGGSNLARDVNKAMNRILEVLYRKSERRLPGAPIKLNLGALEGAVQIRVRNLNKSFKGAIRVDGQNIYINNPQASGVVEVTEFRGDPSTGLVDFVVPGVDQEPDLQLIQDLSHEICRTNPVECPPELENRYLISAGITEMVKTDVLLIAMVHQIKNEAMRLNAARSGVASNPCVDTLKADRKEIEKLETLSADLAQVARGVIPHDVKGENNFATNGQLAADIEAAISAPDQAQCETIRSTLIASGLIIPETPSCRTGSSSCRSRIGCDSRQFEFLFYSKGQAILRGLPITPESCRQAVNALYSSAVSGRGVESLGGYCEDVPGVPGMERLVFDTLTSQNGTDSLVMTKDVAACAFARDALINTGLGVELKPVKCRQMGISGPDFGPENAALELMIENPYSVHHFEGRSLISKRDCEHARDALSQLMLENDSRMGRVQFLLECHGVKDPGMASVRIHIRAPSSLKDLNRPPGAPGTGA